MKTMRLRGGDLALGVTGDYEMVSGVQKVQQDVRCALLEPLGNDRFHPGWGSDLDNFISRTASPATELEVQSEVNRVLSNYAAVQRDKIEADMYSGEETRYSTDEVLGAIKGVSSRVNDEYLRITIAVSTVSGDTVAINEVI